MKYNTHFFAGKTLKKNHKDSFLQIPNVVVFSKRKIRLYFQIFANGNSTSWFSSTKANTIFSFSQWNPGNLPVLCLTRGLPEYVKMVSVY
jgi:hypothetical protein